MPKISQKMALMQQLSPQQVLQASLLQLNLPLLEQRILHELEINPALELSDLSSDVNTEELAEEKNEAEEEIEFDWEELLGEHDDFEYPKTREKKDEEFETPIVHKDTFSERIMKQLQDYDMGKEELKISEQVLGNLDEQGYLNIEPSLISDRMGLDEEDVLKVMFKIQRLDTPGLATRNIQECLLVQAEVRNENAEAVIILRDFSLDQKAFLYVSSG
jgi:RNA polymerase sigma-54 factor